MSDKAKMMTAYHSFVIENEDGRFQTLWSASEIAPKAPAGWHVVEKLTTHNLESWWPKMYGKPFWKSEPFIIDEALK